MKTLKAQDKTGELLRAGQVLSITGNALVEWIGNGGVKLGPINITASGTLGPFDTDIEVIISALSDLIYSIDIYTDKDSSILSKGLTNFDLIATRNAPPNIALPAGIATQCEGRTWHIATDYISGFIEYTLWNGYLINGGGEIAATTTSTFWIQVEDKNNNIRGSGMWTLAPNELVQVILPISGIISPGERFWEKTRMESAGGIMYQDKGRSTNLATNQNIGGAAAGYTVAGEYFKYGTNLSNTIGVSGPYPVYANAGSSGSYNSIAAIARRGITKKTGWASFGDSRNGCYGHYATVITENGGLYGEIEWLLKHKTAVLNLASSGRFASENAIAANMPIRMKLAALCGGVIMATGLNDLRTSAGGSAATAATVIANHKALADNLPNRKYCLATVGPVTSATDGQSGDVGGDRLTYNKVVRNGVYWADCFIDTAYYSEAMTPDATPDNSPAYSGLWSKSEFSHDGIHGSGAYRAYLLDQPPILLNF